MARGTQGRARRAQERYRVLQGLQGVPREGPGAFQGDQGAPGARQERPVVFQGGQGAPITGCTITLKNLICSITENMD